MGLRGPAPKPTELRRVEGNPSRRPLNDEEPQPAVELFPEPPEWLSPEARVYWDARVPALVQCRLMTKADKDTFGRWCELLVEWLKAKDFIQQHGSTYHVYDNLPVLDDNGQPRMNDLNQPILARRIKYVGQLPQVSIFRNLATELRQLEQEFGMTPASRSRITVPDGSKSGDKPRSRFSYYDRAQAISGAKRQP